jgi:hypothetical protein
MLLTVLCSLLSTELSRPLAAASLSAISSSCLRTRMTRVEEWEKSVWGKPQFGQHNSLSIKGCNHYKRNYFIFFTTEGAEIAEESTSAKHFKKII